MLKHISIVTILVVMFASIVLGAYSNHSDAYEMPNSIIKAEKISPYDHVKQEQIKVFRDRVVIYIDNATWAQFTDTNSMDPIIDIGANSIELRPKSANDIHLGDIISYKSNLIEGIIIHRVVDVSEDKDGPYFITKGDNNIIRDPEKVRFDQVHGVVIGVIY